MRRVTATAAARGFSELLDEVERSGEPVVIERHGRAVATIGPAPPPAGNGWRLLQAVREHPADAAWPEEIADLRRFIGPPRDRWSG